MSIGATIYNVLFRRTSTAAVTICVGAYITERIVDEGARVVWLNANKGILWDDIKHKYEK